MELGWFEVSLDVKNIEKSIAFYEAVGFRQVGTRSDPRTATLQKGDCRIGLFQGYLDPARPQLIFWQGDVEAIAADLTANGLTPAKPPATDARGTGAMFIDPDGNPLYFVNITGVTREG